MNVNDNACCLDKCVAFAFFASNRASTGCPYRRDREEFEKATHRA